ncbi:MAG TPA: hypothetical protein VLU43_13335 [Anaeromyxobacteraceae bacterium]|nr:hypothetical protein [Anaeromyxobacteraceae bacterium]
MRAALGVLGVLGVLGGAPGPAAAGDTRPACSGTLSGAVEGKFECTATLARGPGGKAVFVVAPRSFPDGVPSYDPGAFEVPEPVSARTYTLDTLGHGMARVAVESGTLYTATKTSSQRGEVTLTLTRATPDPAARGAWTIGGTYRARLLPSGSPRKDAVVVEVRF